LLQSKQLTATVATLLSQRPWLRSKSYRSLSGWITKYRQSSSRQWAQVTESVISWGISKPQRYLRTAKQCQNLLYTFFKFISFSTLLHFNNFLKTFSYFLPPYIMPQFLNTQLTLALFSNIYNTLLHFLYFNP